MEINFQKDGLSWASEFTVNSDFNLHIEGVVEGKVSVYQRGSSEGKYAYVRNATPFNSFGDVYDYDFSAVVYPKYIRVICAAKPTKAVVTYNA